MSNSKVSWQSASVTNWTNEKKVRGKTIAYVVPVFVSGVVGFTIPLVLDISIPGNLALLISTCIALLMCALLVVALRLVAVVEIATAHKVSISKDGVREYEYRGRITAFDYCASIANNAKKSIYVVGPHFSSALKSIPKKDSHDNYLSDGMTAAIEKHAYDEFKGFTYFRILQLDSDVMKTVGHNGQISSQAIGDEVLSEHVQQCLDLAKKGVADIQIHAREFVPSLPSILVIDDKYVFFSLPTHIRETEQGDFDFVFQIEDTTGDIPTQFKTIITKLKNKSSITISSVE